MGLLGNSCNSFKVFYPRYRRQGDIGTGVMLFGSLQNGEEVWVELNDNVVIDTGRGEETPLLGSLSNDLEDFFKGSMVLIMRDCTTFSLSPNEGLCLTPQNIEIVEFSGESQYIQSGWVRALEQTLIDAGDSPNVTIEFLLSNRVAYVNEHENVLPKWSDGYWWRFVVDIGNDTVVSHQVVDSDERAHLASVEPAQESDGYQAYAIGANQFSVDSQLIAFEGHFTKGSYVESLVVFSKEDNRVVAIKAGNKTEQLDVIASERTRLYRNAMIDPNSASQPGRRMLRTFEGPPDVTFKRILETGDAAGPKKGVFEYITHVKGSRFKA